MGRQQYGYSCAERAKEELEKAVRERTQELEKTNNELTFQNEEKEKELLN